MYFSSVIKMDRYKQIQPYLKESGISITVEPSKNSLFKILAQFIKQNRNTIFITNDWLKIPVCMLITHFLRGNPYILVLNGAFWKGWEEEGWSKARIYLYSFLANLVIRNCSYLVCNSNYIRLDVNKQFPSSRNKTRTIYNGIETQNSVSFQKFLYSSEKYNFLTINTFDYKEKYKGIIIILEALSRLFENTARLCILASINSNMGWDILIILNCWLLNGSLISALTSSPMLMFLNSLTRTMRSLFTVLTQIAQIACPELSSNLSRQACPQ